MDAATPFDTVLSDRCAAVARRRTAAATGAGHDAGILADGRRRHRDAVRAQPDRDLALPRRVRRARRLPARACDALTAVDRPGPGPDHMTTLFASHALLPSGPARDVLIEVDGGRFTSVTPCAAPPGPTRARLPGVVLPGFANAHSHAFHRALRGRTHDGGGTFWTWREADVRAGIARSTRTTTSRWPGRCTREMALAGVTTVGEFHYVHHAPGGPPYSRPERHGRRRCSRPRTTPASGSPCSTPATWRAASTPQAISRWTELQLRFSDKTVESWAARVADIDAGSGTVVGAAIHSVRAVASSDLAQAVAASADRPLHVHLSEQPAENARLPGVLRPYPDRAARGERRAARRAPRPCTPHISPRATSRCSALRGDRLLLPDHRAGPRRRHRSGPRAGGTLAPAVRWAATRTRWST